jgi:hypothetical protein
VTAGRFSWYAAWAVLAFADAYQTILGMTSGVSYEANVLIAWVGSPEGIALASVIGCLVLATASVAFWDLTRADTWMRWACAFVGAALLLGKGYVVVHNAQVLGWI